MAGLYVVADLRALGDAAVAMTQAAGATSAGMGLPSFGHPGADAASAEFAGAAQRHVDGLAVAAGHAAEVLRGYAVAFREVGD